jgi:cell division protein FtsN
MFTTRNQIIAAIVAAVVVVVLGYIAFKPSKKVEVSPAKPAATQQVAPAKPAEPAKKDEKKK